MLQVDLTRTDLYEDHKIPDTDFETCLKVLRTVRDVCLHPSCFDADGAVILSHAHAKLHDMVKQIAEIEEKEAML